MMTRSLSAGLFVTFAFCACGNAAKPLAVGERTCLFLDDHFIDEQTGLERTWHQGQPHPEAIVAETEPSDHWILMHGSCFYDPKYKLYRMYYQSTHLPSGVPGISFRDLICYAESQDGKTWVKPKLGLVEFQGSKDNNIVLEFAGPPNAFVDPQASDPSERLRMLTYVLKGGETSESNVGLCWLVSEDGLHWNFDGAVNTPTFADPAEARFNDLFIVTWDEVRQSYLGNWRGFSKHSIGNLQDNFRRAIGQTTSPDLHQWTPSVTIVRPDELDDRKAAAFGQDPQAPDWAELYIMPQFPYGNHYLGLVTVFCLVDAKDLNGGGDLQFCYSNDGLKWHRQPDRQTAMAPGDDPQLFPTFAQFNPPLDMGDETWIFYCETNGVHGIQDWQKSRGRIRAAVWRKDGFASLACADRGTLVTKPLATSGRELVVNFQTEEGGSVRVGLLDENGEAVSQFNLGECQPLKGDATGQKVQWVGGSDFSKRAGGKPVRLMFELNQARLWSFRFAK